MARLLAAFQDRVAGLLGLAPDRRTPIVHAMLHRPQGDSAGYWLQILIATALATLGLALDSTAVVIGAMLIAPLMRPIVELAMGLATGSTPLVFRTGVRAIGSIIVVLAGSAALTRMLPFHELTAELLARTAPSLLDLFVAAACALAGAYAVVITSSDIATTAAGTSIGISLVPPLCTAGYGISIGDWDMAVGAGLLFTANVTGIITVASAVFVLVGFGQVDIREEERTLDEDANVGAATRFGRAISRRGPARLGALVRVLVPLALLGAIAFPLVRAVHEMSRRSTIRQRVAELMERTNGYRIVQYELDQAARPTTLRVVMVGDTAHAKRLEERLRDELHALYIPNAAVSVWAVSDATSVSALAARIDDVPRVVPAEEPPPPPPPSLEARIRAAWPAQSAGALLSVWTTETTPPSARVTHVGEPLGATALALLARTVSTPDSMPSIGEVALAEVVADPADGARWLPRALELFAHASQHTAVSLCVTLPPRPRARTAATTWELVRRIVQDEARAHAQIELAEGEDWRVTPTMSPCPSSPEPQPIR